MLGDDMAVGNDLHTIKRSNKDHLAMGVLSRHAVVIPVESDEGQLVKELEDRSWLTTPAFPEHVFAYGDDLWPKLARQVFGERTFSALKIKRRPDDPSIN